MVATSDYALKKTRKEYTGIFYTKPTTKTIKKTKGANPMKNTATSEVKPRTNTEPPKFQMRIGSQLMEWLRAGDCLYICDFSRISRSTKDLLELLEALEKRKIKLISLKENLDTSTATGKLMVTMIGAINEFERTNLLERQREGIAIAVNEGKYKGRKNVDKPADWDAVYGQYMTRKLTATEAIQRLGLRKTTFYKFVSEEKQIKTQPT